MSSPNPPRSLLSQTKILLREAGLEARKGLGQHFLVDGAYLKSILEAAELEYEDSVIEVGPGLGVLTRELAARAGRVVAVEKDEKLVSLLKARMSTKTNLTLLNEDILKVNLPGLLAGLAISRYKVVANLPYYITSPVMRFFLEAQFRPELMVVMVQKEVARQISASPGEMSLLSVSVQLYAEPKIVKYVPARAFYPPPEVDSAILKVKVFSSPRVDVDAESFFRIVKAGFSAARKQIINPLSHGLDLPKEKVRAILDRAGIDAGRRAETLSIEEWAEVWKEWSKAQVEK